MDISELKESGQLAIIDASPVPFALYDDDQNVNYLNPEFTKILGYTLEDISTLEQWWLKAYPDKTYRNQVVLEWERRLAHALQQGTDFEPMEIKIQSKSGELKHAIVYMRFLKEQFSGNHLIIITDITELKLAKEQLNSLNSQLETKVAELKAANRKLELVANEDALTGISNRRYFDRCIQSEWMRLSREKHPLSLIMIDIDHFKLFNDTYGHLHGDECLITIARVLEDCTRRPSDIAARYGGEEFVCLLPNTDKTGAIHIAQTILEEVKRKAISHSSSPDAEYVTLSIGVSSCMPSGKLNAHDFIEQADRLLYQAKKAGRSKIVY